MKIPEYIPPLFCSVAAVLLVANVIWGYRDGRRRGYSGLLIAFLVTVTFPLGVFLWLLFRPDVIEQRNTEKDPDDDLKRRANAGLL